MTPVVNYFVHIVEDIDYLFTNPHMSEEALSSRICSLALRVIGGMLAVSAASTIVASLAPISVLGLAGGIFAAAFAYDLIKMGSNIRQINNALDIARLGNLNIFDQIFAIGRSVADFAQAGIYELETDIPYVFRGTILIDPFIRLLQSDNYLPKRDFRL